jgi:hypothetical protein
VITQEFKFSTLNGTTWHVYSERHQSTERSTLVIHRYLPGKPEEIVEVREPKYRDLFQQINNQEPGRYVLLGLTSTQEEWCWLRGVLHCLLVSNANQVSIEATLVGDSLKSP